MSEFWAQTFTGRRFDLLDPRVEDVVLADIAHSLAGSTRFNCHTRSGLSIAEHCIRVSDLCPDGLVLAGLLHDCAETYTGDCISPMKALLQPQWNRIEHRIQDVVAEAFGLDGQMLRAPEVLGADRMALRIEAESGFTHPPVEGWTSKLGVPPPPIREPWEPMSPEEAEAAFLRAFQERLNQ
jgi:hypothetical protein